MTLHIYPFRGIRYTETQAVEKMAAPPYDVIDADGQDQLMARHPHNVVRLNLNPSDTPYQSALDSYTEWQKSDVLAADEQPAFYAYTQSWQDGENKITRRGFLTAILLDDEADSESANFKAATRSVLPHERTIHKYIKDRITLYQTLCINLSPIFLIYDDPTRDLEAPLFKLATQAGNWVTSKDDDGVVHAIQPVSDATVTAYMQQHMKIQRLLIADGHHRFQTALTLKHVAREQYKTEHGTEPALGELPTDYLFAFVTNLADDGLTVYPTHRLINQWPEGMTQETFEANLMQWFNDVDVSEFESNPSTLQYEAAGTGVVKTLLLKPERLAELNIPKALEALDVTLLDNVVMRGFFKARAQDLKADGVLRFDRDEAVAKAQLASKQSVAAFWTHAPDVRAVKTICESGELMPQKSTYFYPKLQTGLVFYPYHALATKQGTSTNTVGKPISIDSFKNTVWAE